MTKNLSNIILWIIEDNAAFRSNLTEALNEIENIQVRQDFSSCEEAIEHLPNAQIVLKLRWFQNSSFLIYLFLVLAV